MTKQSEIARKFDLPERQSKLNTMLREEGLKDEQVYCICRSSDVSRFMIGCDYCEEWYHGDCIDVTEHEANKIRKFYCKRCRNKHPSLQIKYKEKRSHHHHKHRHDRDKHRQKDSRKKEKEHSSRSKSEKDLEKCGECEACYIREDCGRCEYCKDMTKFGGTGKLKTKCKKRQCQNFYHLAKKHSQVSSLKSSSSEKQRSTDYSRSDHSYNAQSKNSSKSSHSINPQQQQTETKNKDNKNNDDMKHISSNCSVIIKSMSNYLTNRGIPIVSSSPGITVREPTISQSSLKTETVVTSSASSLVSPLANLTNSSNNRPSPVLCLPTTKTPGPSSVVMTPNVTVLNEDKIDKDVDNEPGNDDTPWSPSRKKKSKDIAVSRKRKALLAARKRKSQDSGSDSDDPWGGMLDSQGPRQCMGPQCIKAARKGSKYCQDECGLKLAEARIYSVLPQRIQEWKMSSCEAEERERKQLEKIRSQQLEARRALQALDEKHKELDILLEKWKSVSIDPQADEEGDEEGSEGALVYCVTCGHEVPTRRAIKHMHSCYNKLESQMSFGSMFKTRIEGNNMFCDSFNASNRTYCKRLRVMCPEHTKESKTSNTEVCGFPLTKNVFTETGKVCRMSKKKCVKHYCWEKLRRANIDMERVRQCLKLDELVEQERQVRLAMTNRAGVLGLMLHSTYDHEYAAKMQKQQHRQTDHQYHQKEKSHQPLTDFNQRHFKESGYHNQQHHQIASDHHYHRQHPESGQDGVKLPQHSTKKYQPKFVQPAPNSTALSGNHMYQKNFAFNSSLMGNKGGSNQAQPHYQNEHYYHMDNQFNHDHQYFSNQPSSNSDKTRNDHVYYSSKGQK